MVKGKRREVAEIRIFDMLGRSLDMKRAFSGEIVRFGATYKQGIYIIVVLQGNERKVLKVVKQ